MSINKESQKAPNLRFKGFTDDWEQRRLNEISVKVTEKNKDNAFVETFTNSAEFGIISQRDFFDKDISNEKNLNTYYIVRNDDFVYNPRISNFAPVGPIKRNKLNKTGVMSPLYYVFRTLDINKTYLEKYFNSSKWHKFMKLNGDSGARSDRFAIKDSVFNTMPIPYPNLLEQDKIGKFINYVENTITLHQRKLDQLNQLKEALLQQMFPGKGETVPKLRFAGFEGDWEERKLKNIGLIQTGNTPPTKNKDNYSDTGMLWVTPTDINYLIISDTKKRLSNIGIKKARIAKKGSILVTCIASIGKNALAMTDVGFNQQINSLTPQRGYDSYFLLTQSKIWSETMKNNAASGTMQIVNKTDFSNIISSFPTSEEQRRIGLLFNKVDNTITLQQRKLDQLQNMKQVLLQNMFI